MKRKIKSTEELEIEQKENIDNNTKGLYPKLEEIEINSAV